LPSVGSIIIGLGASIIAMIVLSLIVVSFVVTSLGIDGNDVAAGVIGGIVVSVATTFVPFVVVVCGGCGGVDEDEDDAVVVVGATGVGAFDFGGCFCFQVS
jgi:hypothetical protein